jgi:putative zincin peptidase
MIIVTSFIGSLSLFRWLWHRDAFEDIAMQPGGWIGVLLMVIASAIVHEALHAIAWKLFARVPWRAISIRPTWKKMGCAAHLNVRVSTRAYRAGLAAPVVILAFGTIAFGLIANAGLVLLWGLFFLLECFADLTAL